MDGVLFTNRKDKFSSIRSCGDLDTNVTRC